MTPPTPAAVRAAIARAGSDTEWTRSAVQGRDYETQSSADRRYLADHIRALAQEMREVADKCEDANEHEEARSLRFYADRLEGRGHEDA